MDNVNINRYARLLDLPLGDTRNILLTVLTNASKALYGRQNLVQLTEDGFYVYGVPFDQYKTIWQNDRDAIVTDPNQITLVKRMYLELRGWELKPDSWHQDQLNHLKSMSAQDMVRAGLWTQRTTAEELIEEEVEDDL